MSRRLKLLAGLSFVVASLSGRADLLNLSGQPLPRSTLDSSTQKSLANINTTADIRRVLDLICVVHTPDKSTFLDTTDPLYRQAREQGNFAKSGAVERRALQRADRLTKAISAGKVRLDEYGVGNADQIPTTLRTVLLLAISTNSAVRPDAQAWIRTEPQLQVAINAVFQKARRELESDPRSPLAGDFRNANRAVAYLLKETNERSEDAFMALEKFLAKYYV